MKNMTSVGTHNGGLVCCKATKIFAVRHDVRLMRFMLVAEQHTNPSSSCVPTDVAFAPNLAASVFTHAARYSPVHAEH
jgi:hypothetical protein